MTQLPFSKNCRQGSTPPVPRARLVVECLEDRCMPSAALVADLFEPALQDLRDGGGKLLFLVPRSYESQVLYRSDGTAEGTVPLAELSIPSENGDPNYTSIFNASALLGETLLFVAEEEPRNALLWKTDGTVAGTTPVAGSPPFASDGVAGLRVFDGSVYFDTNPRIFRAAHWKSDGTAEGTVEVADIDPALTVAAAGTRFLARSDSIHGNELWKTDGTDAGTVLVKDIAPGGDPVYGPNHSNPGNFTNLNGTLLFQAQDDERIGLWKSDGSVAGTTLVKSPGNGFSYLGNMMTVHGTLFFTVNETELWKSDGTPSGTVLLKSEISTHFVNVDDTLFFMAGNAAHGQELWKSDGTLSGTVLVKDVRPGANGSSPVLHTNVNGTLYFNADDGTHGTELWQSDGTAAGTRLVQDIFPGTEGSFPSNVTVMDGTILFSADDGAHGTEPWQSDGTAAGTTMILDIFPGLEGSSPGNFTVVGNTLYFTAEDGTPGAELWKWVTDLSNTPPTTTGIPPFIFSDETMTAALELRDYFDDAEDGAAGLIYTIQANSNPGLFADISVRDTTDTLLLAFGPDAAGTADLTIRATDAGGLIVKATFTVTVRPVNDAPSFTLGASQVINEDAGQVVDSWATAVSAGPANESGQALTFVVTTDNAALFAVQPAVEVHVSGEVPGDGVDNDGDSFVDEPDSPPVTTGRLVYAPAANAHGAATVTVTLRDNGGVLNGGVDTSAPQSFTIIVAAVADRPILQVEPVYGGVNVAIPLNISCTLADTDGSEEVRIFIGNVPQGVQLNRGSNQGQGPWELRPGDLTGLTITVPRPMRFDLFVSVHVRETSNNSFSAASQWFPVAAVANPALLARNDAATTEEDTRVNIAVLANDTFAAGTRLVSVTQGRHGSVKIRPDETVRYAPDDDFSGSDTFTYTIRDRAGNTETATVSVSVAPVADQPDIHVHNNRGWEGEPIYLSLHAFDRDSDGSEVLTSLRLSGVPEGSILVPGTNLGGGTWDVTQAPNNWINNQLTLPDDGVFTLTATAVATERWSGATATTTKSFVITTRNIAPVADFTYQLLPGPGWSAKVLFANVVDAAADIAAGFTYSYDFNNDGDFTDPGDLRNLREAGVVHAFPAPGSYTVRGRIQDKDGGFNDYRAFVYVDPPAVERVVFPHGSPQRSMVTSMLVFFNRRVDILPGAFEVLGADGRPVPLNVEMYEFDFNKTSVRLTFPGNDLIAGSLADGRYTLIVHASRVYYPVGGLLDGNRDGLGGDDYTQAFHRLFGDEDGDRDVDGFDALAFFGALAGRRYDLFGFAFDYDNNGNLDLAVDGTAFFANLGRSL